MKKKLLQFLLLGTLSLALTGCGNKDSGQGVLGKGDKKSQVKATEMPLLKDATKMGYHTNALDPCPGAYKYAERENHGTIQVFDYESKNYNGDQSVVKKQAKVYLPYGYDANRERPYNVFYLMHGGGGDLRFYFDDNSDETMIGILFDNMIANGDLEPCIIVAPTYNNDKSSDDWGNASKYGKELVNDLIPSFESNYNTAYKKESGNNISTKEKATRLNRAFGGFSMGGATTWGIFETCLTQVGYFLPISGTYNTGNEDAMKHFSESIEKQGMTEDDFLLFYACGNNFDLAYDGALAQFETMKKEGSPFKYCENYADGNFYCGSWSGGGHDFDTVCTAIYNALPQFFEKEPGYLNTWAQTIIKEQEDKNIWKKNKKNEYGKIIKETYHSSVINKDRPVNVLMPPNYDESMKYPVLYLLHGYYDNQDWMKEMVNIKEIVGNLTTTGQMRDAIIVMPYIFCSPDKDECDDMNEANSQAYDNFVKEMTADLMPFIEKGFPVLTGPENTAITGFSMGGRESLTIAFTNSDKFGYVGACCPAPLTAPSEQNKQFPQLLAEDDLKYDETKPVPYLTFITAAGKDEAVFDAPSTTRDIMVKNGINPLWNMIPDAGHSADTCIVHVNNYLKMLFKK